MKLSKNQWNRCPIRYFAGLVGDKWSLLIIRDLMFRGKQNFNALKRSSEGISTNILSDRLNTLTENGIVESFQDESDGRSKCYSLTKKGWDLFPVMKMVFEWSYRYDEQSYLNKSNESCFIGDTDNLKALYQNGKTLDFNEP